MLRNLIASSADLSQKEIRKALTFLNDQSTESDTQREGVLYMTDYLGYINKCNAIELYHKYVIILLSSH